uniref:Serine-rich adhesin for platelets n=1 Tax=Musca domestica TaxID=7370 RepID=A0A1I8MQI0_MUSDO
MLLIILAFLMKISDISKMHGKRFMLNNANGNHNNSNHNNSNTNTNNGNMSHKHKWQHIVAGGKTSTNHNNNNSNSSSTSSGCDSAASSQSTNSSSKENNYHHQQHQEHLQNVSLTPQQLQKLRYYQQLQQQQLQLLQQQLIQRKRLQQQLREQGVEISSKASGKTTTPALTCNQQYLRQMRQQQQIYQVMRPEQHQQQQQQHFQKPQQLDNYMFHNKNINDILNNNNNNITTNDYFLQQQMQQFNDGQQQHNAMHFQGQKSNRGMTEFSTNNDINNKSHHLSSQPLQNSPRHHHYLANNHTTNFTTPQQQHHHPNNTHNTTFNAQFNKQFTQTLKQQLINNCKNNQITTTPSATNATNATTTTINSSANINNKFNDVLRSPSSNGSSVTHSPTHYRKPFNSPQNSPFTGGITCGQQHLLQQRRKLPFLTHTQYQQHLNDLLSQQQHLQQQQQQLLLGKDASASATDDELSEESLKQNVAIVLSNLDRYNNALRSIILNEQVNTNTASSSVFYDESDLNFLNCGNNNQQLSNNMATAITPESDYNSNATTPGSRSNNMLPPYDSSASSNMLPNQAQQQLVGYTHNNVSSGINNACSGGGVGVGVGNAYMGNNLTCSLASSHDFTHDNSDYQWFLDYGYRDGCGGMQRSVLSSLSASYNGLGDLIYEDLAKNLDANLAEVDMESFRAEDIHSLLSQLPSYCKSLGGNRLQQSLLMQQQQQQHQQHHFMSSQNMTAQQMQQQMAAAQTMSQTSTTSTNDLIDNSFCKSELLFSPVKESHISVDSLDMDGYPDDGDIILTCKANKDNYTIAFEGSVLYSDESFYEPNEIAMKNKQNCINLHSNLDDIVKRKSLEVSMSRSEQPQPCNMRNKLQKSHTTQLQRYPSGNNNNAPDAIIISRPALQQLTNAISGVRKSSSLPNLRDDSQEVMILSQTQIHPLQHQQQLEVKQPLNVSQAISTSNMEANLKCRNLLPMCQIPITANSTAASIDERLNDLAQQQQQLQQQSSGSHHHHHHQQQKHNKHRCCCGGGSSHSSGAGTSHHSTSMASNNGSATLTSHHSNKAHISGSTSSGSSNPPAFNLVKLFIKQKSTNCSLEDQPSAHTCMDVSSGCWPSSDAANSSTSSSLEQRLRKKSMNDSGKGSALSRHDEEEVADASALTFQMDASSSTPKKQQQQQQQRRSSLFYDEEPSSSSTGSLTATNSPAHRRRSMPLRNPALNHLATQHHNSGNNNNSTASLLSSDNTSEQMTQIHLSSGQEASSSSASSSAKAERNKQRRSRDASRPISNASSSEMITRSMQTSCGSLSTRSSLSDRFRCVPPSFLEKLNNLGEERQAPIYVIYPNYALPDLGFVKTSATPDVIFSPFNYKNSIGSASSSCASLKKRFSLMAGSDEDEILKTMDYKHIQDWHSLVTLLPGDYRRRLKHIPQVDGILSQLEAELAQKPLFCLTPPVRRNRPHICDCNQYFQQRDQQQNTGHQAEATAAGASSSSGSSQQPSSGYRGSSTMLTDSEFDASSGSGDNHLKQMYVYQYEQQRMDSGVEMSPKVQSTPVPMPRGILRKSSSAVRNKRNSMIEQDSKQAKLEKRRSLQEPPHHYHIGSAEELAEVFEEEPAGCELYASPQPRSERLSRKDLDARVRAENFLSSLPRNELKYYAEIAAILESSEPEIQYDAAALKKEVSRALSQQKKVSFNDKEAQEQNAANVMQMQPPEARQRFSTPPNSPNISMATTGGAPQNPAALRLQNNAATTTQTTVAAAPRRCSQRDEQEKRKSESNRFKRLQIQWELISKDSSMLKELANAEQTKSGGSTPTSAQAAANAAAAAATAATKSRIPRPVSYPAGKRTDMYNHHTTMTDNNTTTTTPPTTTTIHKNVTVNTKIPKPPRISPQIARITNQADATKTTRSPSRLQPPKRYSMTATPPSSTSAAAATLSSPLTPTTPGGGGSASRARTPNSRVAVTAPNTPKKRVQSPRTIPRVR